MSHSEDGLSAKIVVVGETGVGKTSVLLRQSGHGFTSNLSPTLGASYVATTILIQNVRVCLQIWDTAGQERFRAMAPMYFRGARVAVAMYDITSSDSFVSMKGWIASLKQELELRDPIPLCIVGNKKDLQERNRDVPEEEGKRYAHSIGAHFFETSAKTGVGINQLFQALASQVLELERCGSNSYDFNDSLQLQTKPVPKKNKCC